MRIYTLIVIFAILSTAGFALTNWYSGNHTISDGDSYGSVNLWNASTLSMNGGNVISLDLFGTSAASIGDGAITNGISVWETGSLSMTGGTASSFIQLADTGLVELRGGAFTGWIYAQDSSKIDIYGYDFLYNPNAGSRNGGQLTGRWAYGGSFQFDFVDNIVFDSTYYNHVVLHEYIPEPSTILLLGLSGILLRKKRI